MNDVLLTQCHMLELLWNNFLVEVIILHVLWYTGRAMLRYVSDAGA